jgi:tripartite-type tricarboxylate transporter receptor subunit TctC
MRRAGNIAPFALGIALAFFSIAPAAAQQGAGMFRGKEVSILIGTGPAGGYDISARLLARYFGRYIPGNPTVLARNVPGAGGLRLANQIYNVSPKDGTELGMFPTSVAMEPLFGNKQAKYETTKFTWIGNMDSGSADSCGTWKHSGIKTWEDLKNRETTFGSAGPGAVSSINPKVIAALLGLKTKVILGYTSTHNVINAAIRGELDGSCALNITSTYAEFKDQIASGELTIWISFGQQRAKELPNTPTIYELVTNEADRNVAQLVYGQNLVNRPISAPPGLSPEVTKVLRTAFIETMSDKAFLSDSVKANASVKPMTGEETQKAYENFYKVPKAVVERTIAIEGRNPDESITK